MKVIFVLCVILALLFLFGLCFGIVVEEVLDGIASRKDDYDAFKDHLYKKE